MLPYLYYRRTDTIGSALVSRGSFAVGQMINANVS